MAKLADGTTPNPDGKKFALQIIADEEKEIGQMKTCARVVRGKPAAVEHKHARIG